MKTFELISTTVGSFYKDTMNDQCIAYANKLSLSIQKTCTPGENIVFQRSSCSSLLWEFFLYYYLLCNAPHQPIKFRGNPQGGVDFCAEKFEIHLNAAVQREAIHLPQKLCSLKKTSSWSRIRIDNAPHVSTEIKIWLIAMMPMMNHRCQRSDECHVIKERKFCPYYSSNSFWSQWQKHA